MSMRESFESWALTIWLPEVITVGEDGQYVIEVMEEQWLAFQAAYNMQQAVIDLLMLEWCPNEMTEGQVAEWAKHQQRWDGEAKIQKAAPEDFQE